MSSGDDGVLLAVDIGNTNVKLGAFRGSEMVGNWRLETDPLRLPDEYAALMEVLFRHRQIGFGDIRGVSLSSTVPALVPTFRALADQYLPAELPFVVVSAFSNTGVEVAIDNPREMGADRIVDALAVYRLYRVPAIILDFGTATTFDAVDGQGRLLGTAIAPGFMTAMEGLFQRAARLSRMYRFELGEPLAAIGRNTQDALRSGWVYGYIGLVEGLVQRIKAELGGDVLVLATGGLAEEVIEGTDVIEAYDPLLTLKGLRLYYDLNAADAARTGHLVPEPRQPRER